MVAFINFLEASLPPHELRQRMNLYDYLLKKEQRKRKPLGVKLYTKYMYLMRNELILSAHRNRIEHHTK